MNIQVRSTECAKEKFYNKIATKLNVTQKNYKAYWPLIKMFLNNKKIYLISPLYYNNRFMTDYKEKAELFNVFFIFLNNAPSFPSIVHFLVISILILKNAYIQSHFQSKLLVRLFKTLILIKHMVMIT